MSNVKRFRSAITGRFISAAAAAKSAATSVAEAVKRRLRPSK
jgi:hypothetical protein